MARGQHRHRRIRLDWLIKNQNENRWGNAPRKRAARTRRDAIRAGKLKATPAGVPLSAEVASWVAEKLGKPAAKATKAELATLAG